MVYFQSTFIPYQSETADSTVKEELIPTPDIIDNVYSKIADVSPLSHGRDKFSVIQWTLGSRGSGASPHFHTSAWNSLIYGEFVLS